MTVNDLERCLENSHILDFTKETNDPDFLGWILLRKGKVDDRYLALLDEDEDPI